MTYVVALVLSLALVAFVTRRRKRRIRRAARWLWTHPASTVLFVVFGYAWHRFGFNWALVASVGYTTVVVMGRFWWQRTQGGQSVRHRVDELRGRRRPADPGGPCAVYRLFNADRELLYVGHTTQSDVRARWEQHERLQPWWSEVDLERSRVRWFDTTVEARAAETLAIRTEYPRYNVVSNHRNPIRRVVPRSAQPYASTDRPGVGLNGTAPGE